VKRDTIVAGIDVSMDNLDIAVRPGGAVFTTSRDAGGLDALIARLAPLAPEAVAVDAAGGFETMVAASLAAAGLPVIVVNPAQVRAFAQALRKRAKTGPAGAAAIAHFAAAAKPRWNELCVLSTQCLNRRIPANKTLLKEIAAWEKYRNKYHAKADWQFTTDDAHIKLKHLYPSI
jgi:transposase